MLMAAMTEGENGSIFRGAASRCGTMRRGKRRRRPMTATEKALYGPINPASRRCPFYSEKPDSRARLACRVASYRSLTRHNDDSPHQTGAAASPLSTLPSAFIHMKASQQKSRRGEGALAYAAPTLATILYIHMANPSRGPAFITPPPFLPLSRLFCFTTNMI